MVLSFRCKMKKLIMAFIAVMFVSSSYAASVTGEVIQIYDGDTIKIQDSDGGKFKVRFADIDAPESSQESGQDAKAFLCSLIEGKTVTVKFLTIDVYGRIVGTVYIDRGIVKGFAPLMTNINEEMVRNGWAWFYAEYSKNKEYEKLEIKARKEKLGLWKNKNPQKPGDYRKQMKLEKGKK